jgi:hypothetical protein
LRSRGRQFHTLCGVVTQLAVGRIQRSTGALGPDHKEQRDQEGAAVA